jgi:hypothetical protein
MTTKNVQLLRIIVLTSIYLILLSLPLTQGDSSTTTFSWLMNKLVTPTSGFASRLLELFEFAPYLILIATTVYFILYTSDQSEQNLKKLKLATLFFLGAFIYEIVYTLFILGLTNRYDLYKPTITPFLTLALIFAFSYLVYWKPKPINALAQSDIAPASGTKSTEEKKPFTFSNAIGAIIGLGFFAIIIFGYRASNNKVEQIQEESGYNEKMNQANDVVKSSLTKWFLLLPQLIQLIIIVSISIAISYFLVKECKKYFFVHENESAK